MDTLQTNAQVDLVRSSHCSLYFFQSDAFLSLMCTASDLQIQINQEFLN